MNEITIRGMKQPAKSTLEGDLKWFCESLGLLGVRDKSETALKIFRALLIESKKGPVTIEAISDHVNLSRTAIVHHLNRMRKAGVVLKEGNRWELRSHSLQKMVDEIELDIQRVLKSVREIAEDLDALLDLPVRK
ncbi:MAG: winged helix-turn-helix domain-containing protein [Candidatus Hadarchaeum sp.]|uniref:winged helix-turn-helix domain-containing protein n=1 Tax=Candidatus Hadarchaeum sp. TaxID=2883567 RepID=UPI003D1527EE